MKFSLFNNKPPIIRQPAGLYLSASPIHGLGVFTTLAIKNDTSMGMYIGQPQLVMPTQTRKPNGTIEQALCAAPLDASE